jgi:hypothetical protein
LEFPNGFDSDGETLWVTDSNPEKPQLWQIDPDGQTVERKILLPRWVKPGSIAIESSEFAWIVHDPLFSAEHSPQIPSFQFSKTGQSGEGSRPQRAALLRVSLKDEAEEIRVVQVPSMAAPGPITGLAVVSGRLWLSVGGGLCACVYLIDPQNDGEVLTSFFPRCDPVALTVSRPSKEDDPARILLAAQREGMEAILLERAVLREDDEPGEGVSLLDRTQRFLILEETFRPRAISAVGGILWVLDVEEVDPGSKRSAVIRQYTLR